MSGEVLGEASWKPEVMFGKRTKLRKLAQSDTSRIVGWLNDKEIQRLIGRVKDVIPVEEAQRIERHNQSRTDLVYGIEVEGNLIGLIGLHKIDCETRTAKTVTIIGEKEYWGKGFGADAKTAIIEYSFNELGLETLIAEVDLINRRSINFNLGLGYRVCSTEDKDQTITLLLDKERWQSFLVNVSPTI